MPRVNLIRRWCSRTKSEQTSVSHWWWLSTIRLFVGFHLVRTRPQPGQHEPPWSLIRCHAHRQRSSARKEHPLEATRGKEARRAICGQCLLPWLNIKWQRTGMNMMIIPIDSPVESFGWNKEMELRCCNLCNWKHYPFKSRSGLINTSAGYSAFFDWWHSCEALEIILISWNNYSVFFISYPVRGKNHSNFSGRAFRLHLLNVYIWTKFIFTEASNWTKPRKVNAGIFGKSSWQHIRYSSQSAKGSAKNG